MEVPDCPVLHDWDEETLIRSYFKEGYTYSQICAFLKLRHGIVLTQDQLQVRLKKLNLKRCGEEVETPLHVVSAAILVSICSTLSRTDADIKNMQSMEF